MSKSKLLAPSISFPFETELPQRIGGACIFLDDAFNRQPEINFYSTTVKTLEKYEDKKARYKWVLAMIVHNLRAFKLQLEALAALPPVLRMWRISSELLPIPTHSVTQYIYKDPELLAFMEDNFRGLGNYARHHGIRLSFHPAQYVVLGSQERRIRENAIRELNYYAAVFHMMGYTERHQDGTAINVHVGPKDAAIKPMRKLLKANPAISRFLTLENDEFSWSARDIVDNFGDLVPVVLDVHHYWLMHGKRVRPDLKLVADIRDTWHGVQPKLHHALSSPSLVGNVSQSRPILLKPLLEAGIKKGSLRAHSEHPWHFWSNAYACSFGFDVMWEGKDKNRGAYAIAKQLNLV